MLLALQRVEHLLRWQGEEGECQNDVGHSGQGEQERWGLVRARNTQSTLTRSKATPLIKQARGRTTKRSTAQTSSATESAVEEGGRQRTLSLSPDSFAIVSRWATSGRMGMGFTGGARPEGAPADGQALNEERPMTQPDSVTKQLAVAVMPAMKAQEQRDNKTASAAALTAAADVIKLSSGVTTGSNSQSDRVTDMLHMLQRGQEVVRLETLPCNKTMCSHPLCRGRMPLLKKGMT